MMKREELITAFFEEVGAMRRMMLSPVPVVKGMKSLPSHGQMGILMIISHEGPQNIRDLAKRFCMSSSAATQIVNALVKDKILRRDEHKEDRRQIMVSLTPHGVKVLKEAKKERMASLAKFLGPLTDAELLQLLTLQKKITASIASSR